MYANPWPDTAITTPAGPYQHGIIHELGGLTPRQLAQGGTPQYLLDMATITARIDEWIQAMGDPSAIQYASKALPVTGIMHLMHQRGLGIDVASPGELATALHAGVPASAIVVHGNNKSSADLAMAIDAGVHCIVIDSLDEIRRLTDLGRPANVLLRLTPGVLSKTHASIETASETQKFGLSIRHGLAEQALALVAKAPHLHLRGFHVHMGSDIKDAGSFNAGIGRIVEFAAASNVTLYELNVGGGLGVPYCEHDIAPSITEHVAVLKAAITPHVDANTKIMVEPGRSLVGTAGVTLYEVGTVKTVGNTRFVSVNGGMSDNPRPHLYSALHPFAVAGDDQHNAASEWIPSIVAGMHCESGDLLATHTLLPATITPGDLLFAGVTGAYGYAMASNYNRVPTPPLVGVQDGATATLVAGQRVQDMYRDDTPVDQLPAWLSPQG